MRKRKYKAPVYSVWNKKQNRGVFSLCKTTHINRSKKERRNNAQENDPSERIT